MSPQKSESYYCSTSFRLSEKEHAYGSQIHLLSNPVLASQLTQLCRKDVTQPLINELVTSIYRELLQTVINAEFPRRLVTVPTRMADLHPESHFRGEVIDSETPVVSVNLARAGTLPSHICYSFLNYLMNPIRVRQDHISIARQTNTRAEVTGSSISGHKIGGSVDQSIVLIPDPMGATGSTLCETLDLYKALCQERGEKALKYIAIHCIVTPEYLKRVKDRHPDLIVFAGRLDRGLSSPEILETTPGTFWDQEKGLNANQYIVPGGGGFGEILNNSYV